MRRVANEYARQIRNTMKAIKHTLTERWYAWDNARVEAMNDDEINMYADLDNGEPAFLPRNDEYEVGVSLLCLLASTSTNLNPGRTNITTAKRATPRLDATSACEPTAK